jgi:protein required for attachment to host cells
MPAGRTWILLADGRRARLLVEPRRGGELSESKDWTMSISEAELYDLQDRPPRAFDRVGVGRHAMDGGFDPRAEEERKFLLRVARRLTDAVKAKQLQHLVLAASPRALGVLREALPAEARALVRHETPKDLLDEPAEKIRERLANLRLPAHAEQ